MIHQSINRDSALFIIREDRGIPEGETGAGDRRGRIDRPENRDSALLFTCEAVYNNILGSKIMLETSIEHRVERFVLVSTDKAVRPTNIMGTSKRVADRRWGACHRHR